ncbi:MAG: hypothetical protein J2P26_04080 [Nocardiopsaceae bacterium]|nr:hypothetical protein [Nocardiopsaceae bacterium]
MAQRLGIACEDLKPLNERLISVVDLVATNTGPRTCAASPTTSGPPRSARCSGNPVFR